MCLFHVLHYGFRKRMLLVNTPTGRSTIIVIDILVIVSNLMYSLNLLAPEVLKLALDATPSPNNEQMWDTPAAASSWLKTFAINNESLLKETDVC